MHLYVASSWRNTYYPEVVAALREAGHEVYDFHNPPSGDPDERLRLVIACIFFAKIQEKKIQAIT